MSDADHLLDDDQRADRPADRSTDRRAERRDATPPPARGSKPKEIGGPEGPEPTRYGDWERNGRCSDF